MTLANGENPGQWITDRLGLPVPQPNDLNPIVSMSACIVHRRRRGRTKQILADETCVTTRAIMECGTADETQATRDWSEPEGPVYLDALGMPADYHNGCPCRVETRMQGRPSRGPIAVAGIATARPMKSWQYRRVQSEASAGSKIQKVRGDDSDEGILVDDMQVNALAKSTRVWLFEVKIRRMVFGSGWY